MKVQAHLKNARMAPRKMRLLRGAVIGLSIRDAQAQLSFQRSKAADIMLGVLRSAIANARHNHEIEEDNLMVTDVMVNEGIVFKRFQPASKGVAHPYLKRRSHVTVTVGEITPSAAPLKPKKTEIDTVTVQDLPSREPRGEEVLAGRDAAATGRTSAGEDSALAVHGKKKMQQQGGESTKTHRRKSI